MHSGLKSVYDHTHTNEKKIHKIKYKILQNSTAMFIYISTFTVLKGWEITTSHQMQPSQDAYLNMQPRNNVIRKAGGRAHTAMVSSSTRPAG